MRLQRLREHGHPVRVAQVHLEAAPAASHPEGGGGQELRPAGLAGQLDGFGICGASPVWISGSQSRLAQCAQQLAPVAVGAGKGQRGAQQPHRVLVADPAHRICCGQPGELHGRPCLSPQLCGGQQVPGGGGQADGARSVSPS